MFGKLQTVGTSEAERRTEATSAEVLERLSELSAAGVFNPINSGQSEVLKDEPSEDREVKEEQDVAMS